uniref:Putative secreted protein n=1 Tax=Ixodes ricinus TaxID=34613 RepID=A0A6B0U6H7_IXORI
MYAYLLVCYSLLIRTQARSPSFAASRFPALARLHTSKRQQKGSSTKIKQACDKTSYTSRACAKASRSGHLGYFRDHK